MTPQENALALEGSIASSPSSTRHALIRALRAAVEARVIDCWQCPLLDSYLVTDLSGGTHLLASAQAARLLASLVRGWAPAAHERPEAWERLLESMEDVAETLAWWEVAP